jgi:putative redox protein
MKVSARRREGYLHDLTAGKYKLVADEPSEVGGADAGPTPQQLLALSLASCTAITIEMYADRKGWDVGALEVEVDYETAQKGEPRHFQVLVKLPAGLSEEQIARIKLIATKCPVHRTLIHGATIEDRVELIGDHS